MGLFNSLISYYPISHTLRQEDPIHSPIRCSAATRLIPMPTLLPPFLRSAPAPSFLPTPPPPSFPLLFAIPLHTAVMHASAPLLDLLLTFLILSDIDTILLISYVSSSVVPCPSSLRSRCTAPFPCSARSFPLLPQPQQVCCCPLRLRPPHCICLQHQVSVQHNCPALCHCTAPHTASTTSTQLVSSSPVTLPIVCHCPAMLRHDIAPCRLLLLLLLCCVCSMLLGSTSPLCSASLPPPHRGTTPCLLIPRLCRARSRFRSSSVFVPPPRRRPAPCHLILLLLFCVLRSMFYGSTSPP